MVAPGGGVRGCSGGRGACVVALGGHAWLLPGGWGMHGCSQGGVHGCSWGGMRGCSSGACMVAPRGHAWLLPGGGHAWDTTRYGYTINERAVRILLECILVT